MAVMPQWIWGSRVDIPGEGGRKERAGTWVGSEAWARPACLGARGSREAEGTTQEPPRDHPGPPGLACPLARNGQVGVPQP